MPLYLIGTEHILITFQMAEPEWKLGNYAIKIN